MALKISELTAEDFNGFIANTDTPVVIGFYADWCVPCRQMAVYMEALAEKYSDRIVFARANIDSMPDITAHYQVMSIPMLMAFKNGRSVDKIIGENHTATERMLDRLVK